MKAVVHIYNRMLFSHKRESIWVSSNKLDEPRAYNAEWSTSETEKQILYINPYIWNLEKGTDEHIFREPKETQT